MDSYLTRLHEITTPLPPRLCYFIAATPRTGSTVLSDLLCNTGRAGYPTEYFEPRNSQEYMRAFEVDSFPAFFDAIIRRFRTPNGVVGIKIMWDQFHSQLLPKLRTLPDSVDASDGELVGQTFPQTRYVFLRRKDKIRQAISLEKAIQTRVWFQRAEVPHRPTIEPQFDFERIRGHIHSILQDEENWLRYFREAAVTPLEINYEDLVENPLWGLEEVMEFLGIADGSKLTAVSNLKRQADDVTDDWLRRYERIAIGEEPASEHDHILVRSNAGMA